MAKRKSYVRKVRLTNQNKRTKWAPFWVIPKAKGKGKRVHPSQLTRIKRSWRRGTIQQKYKMKEKRREGIEFKSGRIRKKY